MAKKIEISEADLKQIILLMKMSKPYVNIPHPGNLRLENLWRISGKLADKLMRKAELALVVINGKTTLKSLEEVKSTETQDEVTKEGEETKEPTENIQSVDESQKDTSSTEDTTKTTETPTEQTEKVYRCRKRKK